MGLDGEGAVSIVELVLYAPLMILAIIVCSRHGFSRSSGWIYTIFLCLARISGAACQLVTYSSPSQGLFKAALIISSIGLAPLLLAALGLIQRFIKWINLGSMHTNFFETKPFWLIKILITVGAILAIVGGTNTKPAADGTIHPETTSQAGIAILIVAFAGIALLLGLSSKYIGVVPKLERLTASALALALPFTGLRLIYSALVTFLHDNTFSLLHGSLGARVGMAIVPEIIVIATYILLGFRLEKLPADVEKIELTNSDRSTTRV
ncbi:hypothetical protein B0H63DRAFT_408350 [Podospora didyma]|uniref:DUF7702 domain-containing protein n=1 Tax=Podospora didyma TaxID=330526 RepID=A0AAE0U919_9PEZI|nr:hypothetical protein B0H63DRAFT_408350 [Podospora didyma]